VDTYASQSRESRAAGRSQTFHHVCDVIDAAAANNPLYRSHLAERLDAVRYQFDLKYWPPMSAMLQALSEDAGQAANTKPAAIDRLTGVATAARRPSLADFLRALLAAIEGIKRPRAGHLPADFRLSDGSMACLVTCLLNLTPEAMIDASYVKRFRQREREARAESPS